MKADPVFSEGLSEGYVLSDKITEVSARDRKRVAMTALTTHADTQSFARSWSAATHGVNSSTRLIA